MRAKFRAAVGSLLVTAVAAVAAGAVVAPAASQADEIGIMAVPGDLCWIHSWPLPWERSVWSTATGPSPVLLYEIAPGHAFRVLAYGANDTYYGRGNGQPEGYLWRGAVNQATCTQ